MPHAVFPVATVIAGVVNLLLAMLPLLVILYFTSEPNGLPLSLLFLPVAILIAALFTPALDRLFKPRPLV